MGASASIQEEVMLEFERAMLTKIEEIRTARGRDILVKRLEDRVSHYKDKEYHDPKSTAIQITVEGKQPVLDALKYLKGARIEENGTHSLESDFSPVPAPPLRCSSQDHAFDVGTVGTASHTSSNGESPGERMSRYCCWQQTCSEVIYYGALAGNDQKSIHDIAQDVIDALIIDDGVESRGHRLALFDGRLERGGVGVSEHAVYGNVVVVNLAAAIYEEGDVSEGYTIQVGDEEEPRSLIEVMKERKAVFEKRVRDGRPLQLPETFVALERRKKGDKTDAGTQWGNMGTCCGCREEVRGGRVMEVKSSGGDRQLFHADCFKCAICKTPLKGVPFKEKEDSSSGKDAGKGKENPFVCEKCWGSKCAPRCVQCGEPILKQGLISDKSKFHPECFEKKKGCGRSRAGGSKGVAPVGASLEAAKKRMSSITADYAALDAWSTCEDGCAQLCRPQRGISSIGTLVLLMCLGLSLLAAGARSAGTDWPQELYNVSVSRYSRRKTATTGDGTLLPLQSLHLIRVPKAASSSLSQLARRMAGCDPPGPCCKYPGEPKGSCPRKELFACSSEAGGPIVGCTSHKHNYQQLLNSSVPSISMMREPISRSVSAYYYPGVHHNSNCLRGRGTHKRCFSQYVKSTKWSNVVVKLLSGADAYAPTATCSEATPGWRGRCAHTLETALANLRRLSFMGVAEMWELSVLLLYEQFPQLEPLRGDFLLQSRSRPGAQGETERDAARMTVPPRDLSYAEFKERAESDSAVRKALFQQNEYDVALYRHVVMDLRRRLDETGLWGEPRVRGYWEEKYPRLFPLSPAKN
jgi:hypothetical protein